MQNAGCRMQDARRLKWTNQAEARFPREFLIDKRLARVRAFSSRNEVLKHFAAKSGRLNPKIQYNIERGVPYIRYRP
jgi:hypothetical protein